MKFIVCPECGAHLDHGESCDCKKKAPAVSKQTRCKKITSPFSHITISEKGKQLKLQI